MLTDFGQKEKAKQEEMIKKCVEIAIKNHGEPEDLTQMRLIEYEQSIREASEKNISGKPEGAPEWYTSFSVHYYKLNKVAFFFIITFFHTNRYYPLSPDDWVIYEPEFLVFGTKVDNDWSIKIGEVTNQMQGNVNINFGKGG